MKLSDSDSDAEELYERYCKPKLARFMRMARLDAVIVAARGDEVTLKTPYGQETVLDLLGGYGANLFGHNHEALVEVVRASLSSSAAMHAQSSRRDAAGALGRRLDAAFRERFGQSVITTLVSTGAEAVEAAIKHATLELRARIGRLRREIVHRHTRALVEVETASHVTGGAVAALDRLFREALAEIDRAVAAPPAFLSLVGAFHGKTTGALALTWDPTYRDPFAGLGPACRFVDPFGDPSALEAAVAEHVREITVPVLEGGEVRSSRISFSTLAAMFLEPIQGEGGVRELPRAFVAEARRLADLHGFPLVMDEIQSGMGRTGTFLYAEQLGVKPDYVVLSKSLGGSVVKIGALVVDRARYVEDFSLLHTSTFAEDDVSASVALRALGLVLDDGGAVLRRCREQGERLRAGLVGVQERHGRDVVLDVRGRGLMLAVELATPSASRSMALHTLAETGFFAYVVASYLLREHGIRVGASLARKNTLRVSPSAFVTDAVIARTVAALDETCERIAAGDAFAFVRGLVGRPPTRAERPTREAVARASLTRFEPPMAPRNDEPDDEPSAPIRRVGFIGHLATATDLAHWEKTFAPLSFAECVELLGFPGIRVQRFPAKVVESTTGARVEFRFIGLAFSAETIAMHAARGTDEVFRDAVLEAVALAEADGCATVGFGGASSIITANCTNVPRSRIALTSGNALTVGMGLLAIEDAARARGIDLTTSTVAIVGGGGNIGSTYARLLASRCARLVLVGRPARRDALLALAAELESSSGRGGVHVTSDMLAVRDASIVVAASSSHVPLIRPEHVGHGPVVINDVAVPPDTDPSVNAERPSATVLQGGLVRLPKNPEFQLPGVRLPPGVVFACMAETMLLGLERDDRSFSVGAIDPARVDAALAMARRHGFVVAAEPTASSFVFGSNAAGSAT